MEKQEESYMPATANEYYGTKRITAWPANKDAKDGYMVKYADGYTSWSPKDVFEAAYQRLDALSFGHALQALKDGHKVARKGWNGAGQWLYLVGPGEYPAATKIAKAHWGENALVPYRPYIAIKPVDGIVVPWLASQTDMLADDWMVIA